MALSKAATAHAATPFEAADARPATPLESHILHAEQRLMAREARLRQHTQALNQRVQRATQPGRLVWPLLGAALLVWAGRKALLPLARRAVASPRLASWVLAVAAPLARHLFKRQPPPPQR